MPIDLKLLGQLILDENPYTRQAAETRIQMADNGSEAIDEVVEEAGRATPGGERIARGAATDAQAAGFGKLTQLHRAVQTQMQFDESGSNQPEIQRDYIESSWNFKGETRGVSRSLRIQYCFRDAYGQMVEEYVLIGFEGSSTYG